MLYFLSMEAVALVEVVHQMAVEAWVVVEDHQEGAITDTVRNV